MTGKHFFRRLWITAEDTVQDWVPGKPTELDQLIKKLAGAAARFGAGAERLRKLNTDSWQGEAAETFREVVKRLPKELDEALDAFVTASLAVLAYRDVLDDAQRLTQRIIEHEAPAARELSRMYAKAVDDYNAAVKSGDTTAAKPPEDDPGTTLMTELVGMIQSAQGDVEDAASAAKRSLHKAAENAPKRPSGWARFRGGVKEAVKDVTDFALTVDPGRLLREPGSYLHDGAMALDGGITAAKDPVAFSKNVYQGVSDTWDEFEKDPMRMLGYFAPGAVGGATLRGAGGALARRLDGPNALARATGLGTGGDHVDGGEPGGHSNNSPAAHHDPTDPVDLATGKMYLPQTDLALPGVLPLVFKRRAESGYRAGRWFGPSWSSTADQRLEIEAERIVFVHEDGLILVYPHPRPGEATLPTEGPRWPLRAEREGYTVSDPPTGRVWHFTAHADDHALLEQVDDRNGNWITFEYDTDGAPAALAHSGGHRVRITTEDHRITALHLVGAASDGGDEELIRYGYSDAGDLTEVVNSSGLPLRFTYDEAGRITSWTDTNDRGYTYEYDDRDRCVAEGGAEGHMSLRLDYGERDPETGLRTTTATTGTGHVHRYLVNGLCQVVAETDPLGAVTLFERDRYNRLLSRTDPLGHTTSFRYDETGNLISVVRPDGREARAEYNALRLPVSVVNPDGTVVRQTYDERGNRTSVTAPTGQTTRFTYDEAGHLTAVTDPLGHTTTVRCDRAGLPIEVTDPLGAVTRYERDAFGRPVTLTDPTGAVTRLEWTVEGHLARRTAADGTTESWTYDGEGNCTSHTDPLGGVSHFEYTHFDLLAARTGPDGVRYEFTHDTELRLTEVTNPQGLTWTYAYDAAGRLVAETDFDDRTLTYEYDAAGRLTGRRNALGEAVSFERNELGQVLRKDAAGQVTVHAYDLTDQLAQATGPDGTTLTLLRDRYGRLHSETVDGRTLTYTYDALGRRTGRTTPMGARTTWSYDACGRRTGMVASGRAIDFTYDEAGRELTRRIGGTIALQHTFDVLGRLTAQSVTGAGGRTVQHRTYTYRADGNLIGVDDLLTGSRRFDLDTTGRVTAVHAANWTERYAYDEAGNQTQASWPPDHPGGEATGARSYVGTRITRAGNVRYEHDALGRITLRQKTRLSRKPDTWRYEWNAEDRLTSVVNPDGTRWRYTYDPLGRRTAKLRLADDGETVLERVDFTWDGTTLCEQTTTSPDLPNPVTLTWDHQGLRPLSQTERITAADAPQEEIDSRFFAIVTDLVGTPNELIDEQGDIAWRTRSRLWGTTAWAANSTAYTPLRFPGQYYDPETGLHYNYFRHYDPETARYLTPDPFGLAPSPNPDTYVPNPHRWGDPLGLAPVECPHRTERVPDEDLRTLYHYTNEKGYNGILESNELRASLKANNVNDARFGDGQYLSDIQPGTKTRGQLSYAFVRLPWAGHKFTHYIEVDVRGLEVMRSVERPDVYVIHNQGPLDVTGRIVSHGKS
ncbi:HYD1 signature containing ADP-ribosyltransferase family protein [Streptomyces sp. NPDC051636]|uniref:HYD1 signature containing ADP-ribosyltransferase family protein n=1 Tax=Streptomyces sp. NPDC051636 TaxID=3365663 RepID=UPI0037A7AF38